MHSGSAARVFWIHSEGQGIMICMPSGRARVGIAFMLFRCLERAFGIFQPLGLAVWVSWGAAELLQQMLILALSLLVRNAKHEY